jgi:hypothetical protein
VSRRRALGVLVLVVVALSGACAAATSSDGFPDDGDASVGPDAKRGDDAAGGPSPDALVTGDDGDGGGDADLGSKSCAGLPDGTPCGPAPDICHDAPVCAGGACAPAPPKADGFVCGPAPDVCHDAQVCSSGVCAPAPAKADGFVCAPAADVCHADGTCKSGVCGAVTARPEGYQWMAGDDTARCCGGQAVHTTTDSNCGVCGIKCNTGNGESCQALGGHYFCRGCVASAACWSHCCSTSFTPYSCAASDCAGNCSSMYCPPGTHCVSGGTTSSDYCSY